MAENGNAALGHLDMPEIDFQDIIYYAAPKKEYGKTKGNRSRTE